MQTAHLPNIELPNVPSYSLRYSWIICRWCHHNERVLPPISEHCRSDWPHVVAELTPVWGLWSHTHVPSFLRHQKPTSICSHNFVMSNHRAREIPSRVAARSPKGLELRWSSRGSGNYGNYGLMTSRERWSWCHEVKTVRGGGGPEGCRSRAPRAPVLLQPHSLSLWRDFSPQFQTCLCYLKLRSRRKQTRRPLRVTRIPVLSIHQWS